MGLVVVVLLISVGRQMGGRLPQFAEWVANLGVFGPLIFIAGYAGATVAFVPGSVLTLAAGAIFGLARGVTYVMIGASIGACLAFLVARYFARTAIEQRLSRHSSFAAIDRAIGREGRKIVFLLRLSPVFPFNLLNYALGLTNVRFADYLIACLGMIPGTFLYIYYGKLAGDIAQLASGTPAGRGTEYYVLLFLGLVATILATTIVTRTARQALQEATKNPETT
jgi:uncharacterized membrane protein YdjX (TVP38/TMEM64 family)